MPRDVLLALPSLFAASVFALVHLKAPKLYGFSKEYAQPILSFSGGIAAAFVFLDLLPLLQGAEYHFNVLFGESAFAGLFREKAIFGVAFLGFLSFFAVEYFAVRSRSERTRAGGPRGEEATASRRVFYVHLGLTALLSLTISYSLRFEIRAGLWSALLYTVALVLSFLVADRTLEGHYGQVFVDRGRYILSVMPLAGWTLSRFFPEHRSEAYVILSFVAGAVLFTVIKDEVPQGGKGRQSFFFAGALLYAALVLLLAGINE